MADVPGEISNGGGRRRWTREEYYRMDDMGLFGDVRVELLDGDIWNVPPPTPPRMTVMQGASDWLRAACGDAFSIRQRGPLVLGDNSEPEPDVVVVPGSWRDYADHHPTAAEVRLLVEVSDKAIAKNRGTKARLYAAAGIADYWIINLFYRQLEIHRDPAVLTFDGAVYRTRKILLAGETVTPLFAPEALITVAELFPSKNVSQDAPQPPIMGE